MDTLLWTVLHSPVYKPLNWRGAGNTRAEGGGGYFTLDLPKNKIAIYSTKSTYYLTPFCRSNYMNNLTRG